jgi:5'/3'-nucleotidase SurE
MVNQSAQTRPYWPPATTPDLHDPNRTATDAEKSDNKRPWILVNSTPASCSQLGLNGPFFRNPTTTSSATSSTSSTTPTTDALPPIDLVISGPNFGRNTTAVFALSSGTLGAALEACLCGQRAIALSFAYFRQEADWNDAGAVREACEQGVRVCEFLASQEPQTEAWRTGLLYSVNVPVKVGVTGNKVRWTKMLGNQWTRGGCFEEVVEEEVGTDSAAKEDGADEEEARHFKWNPKFQDVYDSVQRAGPGSDGWAVKESETSITALMANFMHADGFSGDVKL